MHTPARKHLVKLATDHKKSPFGAAVLAAHEPEVEAVVPSRLKTNLTDAGYEIKSEKRKNGYFVQITQRLDKLLEEGNKTAEDFVECETRDPKAKKPDSATQLVVAQAYSHSENDAVMQAVYAELKEFEGTVDKKNAGIATTQKVKK